MKNKLKKFQSYVSGNCLDLGCGEKPYQTIFKKVDYYVGTNSKSYYINAIDSYPDETDVIVNDGGVLPFSNGKLDSVLCFQVLPVFEDMNRFYQEIKRVLKTDGTFILTSDFLYPIWNAPYNFWRTTKYGLTKLAATNGFKVIATESYGGYWTMQARLLERYFRTYLSNLIKSLKKDKNGVYKALKILFVFVWLAVVLMSPVIINLLMLFFHLMDKIVTDEDFTTNYIIVMQKSEGE